MALEHSLLALATATSTFLTAFGLREPSALSCLGAVLLAVASVGFFILGHRFVIAEAGYDSGELEPIGDMAEGDGDSGREMAFLATLIGLFFAGGLCIGASSPHHGRSTPLARQPGARGVPGDASSPGVSVAPPEEPGDAGMADPVPRPPCASDVGKDAPPQASLAANRAYDRDGFLALGCQEGPMHALPWASWSKGVPGFFQQFDGGVVIASARGWSSVLYPTERRFLRGASGSLDLERAGGFPLERRECRHVAQIHIVVGVDGSVVGVMFRALQWNDYRLIRRPVVAAWTRGLESGLVLMPAETGTENGSAPEEKFENGRSLLASDDRGQPERVDPDRIIAACA